MKKITILLIFLILNAVFLFGMSDDFSLPLSLYILFYFYINFFSILIFLNLVVLFLNRFNFITRNNILISKIFNKRKTKLFLILLIVSSAFFIALSNFYRINIEEGHVVKCNKCKNSKDICNENMSSKCELVDYSCQDSRDFDGWAPCQDIIDCEYNCPLSYFKLPSVIDLLKVKNK